MAITFCIGLLKGHSVQYSGYYSGMISRNHMFRGFGYCNRILFRTTVFEITIGRWSMVKNQSRAENFGENKG